MSLTAAVHYSASYDLPPTVVDGKAHAVRGSFPWLFAINEANALAYLKRFEPGATNIKLVVKRPFVMVDSLLVLT